MSKRIDKAQQAKNLARAKHAAKRRAAEIKWDNEERVPDWPVDDYYGDKPDDFGYYTGPYQDGPE